MIHTLPRLLRDFTCIIRVRPRVCFRTSQMISLEMSPIAPCVTIGRWPTARGHVNNIMRIAKSRETVEQRLCRKKLVFLVCLNVVGFYFYFTIIMLSLLYRAIRIMIKKFKKKKRQTRPYVRRAIRYTVSPERRFLRDFIAYFCVFRQRRNSTCIICTPKGK